MNLNLFSVVVFALGAIEIRSTFRRFEQGRLGLQLLALTTVIWVAIGVTVLYPNVIDGVAAAAGFQHRIFFALAVAFVFLLQSNFRLDAELDYHSRLNDRHTQEIALLNYKLEEMNHTKSVQQGP